MILREITNRTNAAGGGGAQDDAASHELAEMRATMARIHRSSGIAIKHDISGCSEGFLKHTQQTIGQ